ncbi:MAG: hypothetical protein ABUK01_06985 [Leptospirales bacterium]
MSKTNVRWALFIFITSYLSYTLQNAPETMTGVKDTFNGLFIYTLAGTVFILNFLYTVYLWKARNSSRTLHSLLKYITMLFDCMLVTMLLLLTGGDKSMFFLLYVIVIISNGTRYGMRLAVAGIILFNICYVAMLFYQYYPNLDVADVRGESLKVIGVWVVGLYIGYLARRFEILHSDLDQYKNMVAKYLKEGKSIEDTERSAEQ